jgi:hypothetical protein
MWPNPEAQAQTFLKHYYTTCVSDPANLYSLYAADAAVCRDGQLSHVPVAAGSPIGLPLPPGASITVLNLTCASLERALHITVAGSVAAAGDQRRGFLQSFALADLHDAHLIALDVFAFIDDAFYRAPRPSVSFSVPEPPSPPASRFVCGPISSADKPAPSQSSQSEQPPGDSHPPPAHGTQFAPALGPRGGGSRKVDRFHWSPDQDGH